MDVSEMDLSHSRHDFNSRSCHSLGSLLLHSGQEALKLPSSVKQMALARHESVANLAGMNKPPPMKAIQKVSAQAFQPGDVTPTDHLCKLLDTKLDRVPYDALGAYFLETTPEHIAAWDGDLLRAVRTQDFELIQKMHQEGKPLQACNQFSESILHVCVRRGTPEILNYLLRDANLSPRVRCDYGRTPLHDSLWTFDGSERSLKMMALLLRQCPEMLLVADKRGFTPLDYVPRDQWPACCKFLTRCMPFLSRLKNNGRSGAAA